MFTCFVVLFNMLGCVTCPPRRFASMRQFYDDEDFFGDEDNNDSSRPDSKKVRKQPRINKYRGHQAMLDDAAIEALQLQNSSLREVVAQLQSENRVLQKSFDDYKEKADIWKLKVKNIKTADDERIQQLASEIATMRDQLDAQSPDAIGKLRREIGELQRAKSQDERLVSELQTQLKHAGASVATNSPLTPTAAASSSRGGSVSSGHSPIKEDTAYRLQLEATVKSQAGRIETLEELARMREVANGRDVASLQEQLRNSDAQVKHLASLMDATSTTAGTSRRASFAFDAAVAGHDGENSNASSGVTDAHDSAIAATMRCCELETQLTDMTDRARQAEARVEELTHKIAADASKTEEWKRKVKELKTMDDAKIAELKAALDKSEDDLCVKLAETTAAFANEKRSWHLNVQQLTAELAAADEQHDALASRVKELEVDAATMRETSENAKAVKAAAGEQVLTLKTRVAELEARLAATAESAAKESDTHRAHAAELDKRVKQLATDAAALHDRAEVSRIKAKDVKTADEQRIAALTATVAELEGKVTATANGATAELEHERARLAVLENTVHELRSQDATLGQKLEAWKVKAKEIKTADDQKITQLSEALAESRRDAEQSRSLAEQRRAECVSAVEARTVELQVARDAAASAEHHIAESFARSHRDQVAASAAQVAELTESLTDAMRQRDELAVANAQLSMSNQAASETVADSERQLAAAEERVVAARAEAASATSELATCKQQLQQALHQSSQQQHSSRSAVVSDLRADIMADVRDASVPSFVRAASGGVTDRDLISMAQRQSMRDAELSAMRNDLAQMRRELVAARDANAYLTHALDTRAEKAESEKRDEQLLLTASYVRSVVVQFLRAHGHDDQRLKMIKALATALQFTDAEKTEIAHRIPGAHF